MLKLRTKDRRQPPAEAARDEQMYLDLGFVPRLSPVEEDYPVERGPIGRDHRTRDMFS